MSLTKCCRKLDHYTFIEIQVKSTRSLNYIFAQKEKFILRENLYMAVVIFTEGNLPELFLISSLAWQSPNQLVVSRDYEGRKSKPEWGLNLSQKNLHALEKFQFDEVVNTLCK